MRFLFQLTELMTGSGVDWDTQVAVCEGTLAQSVSFVGRRWPLFWTGFCRSVLRQLIWATTL